MTESLFTDDTVVLKADPNVTAVVQVRKIKALKFDKTSDFASRHGAM